MAKKILLVDDEPYIEDLIRQKFRSAIKKGELVFEYVSNGQLAIEKLRNDDSFDLIFTDINMPEMNGLELLEKIKEHKVLAKAIVISAYSDLSNIRIAMNRGAFDFITKPIDLSDLETTMYKTIEEMEMIRMGVHATKNLEQALIDKAAAQQQALENLQAKEKLILQQNEMLEQQVNERTHELQQQKQLIEIKNKEILDSIHYAKHLQEAILPPVNYFNSFFKESFIFYKAKDIVAGDFYWLDPVANGVVVVVADCTGHGVAGALMSMLGVSLLNHIVHDQGVLNPAHILDNLHVAVHKGLQQAQNQSNEGMDIAICYFNFVTKELHYAGANRPLLFSFNNQLHRIVADKRPVGGFQHDFNTKFTEHTLNFDGFNNIYLYTDGYADQFGGPFSKKLMTSKFKEKLLNIQSLPLHDQADFLRNYFSEWKGDHEQVDDVLVMGLRV
jgi:CheY-like chemotaxis protein